MSPLGPYVHFLARIAAGSQAGAVRRLLDALGGRRRDNRVHLFRTFPAVGIELLAGAAGLGPEVLTAVEDPVQERRPQIWHIAIGAATEREGPIIATRAATLHALRIVPSLK